MFEKNIKILDFEDAKKFLADKGIMSTKDWDKYKKSPEFPDFLPKAPSSYKPYKEHWKGLSDFCGFSNVRYEKNAQKFASYEEAKKIIHPYGFKNREEYKNFSKTKNFPQNLPVDPQKCKQYKDFFSWGDYLGTGNKRPQDKIFLEFEIAKQYMANHFPEIKNSTDYRSWKNRPDFLPSNPNLEYENFNWPDFLNTNNFTPSNYEIRSFDEAKLLAVSLKLSSQTEWQEFCRSGKKPIGIPANPHRSYKDKGWNGWADFLGYKGVLNKLHFLSILNNLKESNAIIGFSPVELAVILNQAGIPLSGNFTSSTLGVLVKKLTDLVDSNKTHEEVVAGLDSLKEETEDLINNCDDLNEPDYCDEDYSCEFNDNNFGESHEQIKEIINNFSTKTIKPQDFSCLDIVIKNMPQLNDSEAIEFLLQNRIKNLINCWLTNNGDLDTPEIKNVLNFNNKGEYYKKTTDAFLEIVKKVKSFKIPAGYSFKADSNKKEITEPLIMQKLVAIMLAENNSLLNMCGTGAGKTVASIIASRYCNSKITLIIACNSTIGQWEKVINNSFPDCIVVKKNRNQTKFKNDKNTYVLLNFESFQQKDSSDFAEKILADNIIDFIIIDEVHSIKESSEDKDKQSKRGAILRYIRQQAQQSNDNLRVLGMSATPVINSIAEGKSLLQFVTGKEYPELRVNNKISDAINLHFHLVINGIRHVPEYKDIEKNERIIEIDASDDLQNLLKIRKGDILEMEKALMKHKLSEIIKNLSKGTLVYTQYVDGGSLINFIKTEIEKNGFSCGVFDGQDKSGLSDFVEGKIDVLVASNPIATGVDKLQYVCDKIIIASLPWTSANFEQLIGRVIRQGSKFKNVDIIIPKVIIKDAHDNLWSYDQERIDRIHYKRTLADCAVDGVVFKGELDKPISMLKKCQNALEKWINRLDIDGEYQIERKPYSIPLPENLTNNFIKKYGEFSLMNNNWNNTKSENTHRKLLENPEEWYLYHTLYSQARENWYDIPYKVIADKISSCSPRFHIADLGCGEALLAKELLGKVDKIHSFDHIAINDDVVACDISKLPLGDKSVDIAVLSLSLMGKNYKDYIHEAHRILVNNGRLYVAETKKRWDDSQESLIDIFEKCGFKIDEKTQSGKFFYLEFIKKNF
jgi:superfamily II DNA or RNA helicase